MATDFVPFATAVGANVTSQADYIAEDTTASGFLPGVASSADCNKVWRQATFQAAVLANFVAEELSINVPDDGNLTVAIETLNDAIISAASNASNLTSGTLSAGRLPSTIPSNTTGNAATATLANQITLTPQTANSFFTLALAVSGTTLGFPLANNVLANPSTGALIAQGDISSVAGNIISEAGNVSAAEYLIQGSANNENPTISQVMVTNGTDGILRKASVEALAEALGVNSGSWAPTLSGPWVSGPTGTLKWSRNETHASIWCDSAITQTATSLGSIDVPGLPAAIIPTTNRIVTCGALENNSIANQAGAVQVSSSGSLLINLLQGVGYTAGFTNTGTAGISAGWSITYPL